MRQATSKRPPSRPSPPAHDPRTGYLPNVVGTWNATDGVVADALFPYRDLPEVRTELDALRLRVA